MKISRPVAFGIGAIMTLVIGSGTAYAATGGKFILGHKNHAGQTTTLANKHGTALSLKSKAGTPSLKVNRTTKVPNLNADMIDGLDGTRLALTTGQTNTVSASGELIDFDNDLVPDFIGAVVTCPAGTIMTGGTGEDYTTDGFIALSIPVSRSSWAVASSSTELTQDNADSLFADAICYNPRGAVPFGELRVAPSSTKDFTVLKQKMARKLR